MVVVAVSAGVDSMVLLDCLYKKKMDIVIAHVNYQKRADSFLDAQTIKDFIKDKNIIFEELIVKKEDYNKSNFQAQAREIRYNFFKELCLKYQTNDVYVAHHKDDYLETYLFKKERQGLYDYYGIEETSIHNGMTIQRPLLLMTKDDIYNYAKENKIPYHEDSSNRELDYTRNKIRNRLTKLSYAEKEKLYQETVELNDKTAQQIEFVKQNMSKFLTVSMFNSWSNDIKRRWLFKAIKKYDITTKHLDELIREIAQSNKLKVTFLDTTIIKAYDNIYILDNLVLDYNYLIKNADDYRKFSDLWLNNYNYVIKESNIDYPFVIRNYQKDDLSELGLDGKKFRLKLKKAKIPFFLRDYLPIIEKNGKVITFIY